METVVEEKPLSLATSRIVITDVLTMMVCASTIDRTQRFSVPSPHGFARARLPASGHRDRGPARLGFQVVVGGHYSRVKSLSRLLGIVALALTSGGAAQTARPVEPSVPAGDARQ